jgi:hypothetical protein
VVDVERSRFASGVRLLLGRDDLALDFMARGLEPSIVVDVVRPADLVAFTLVGYNIELVAGPEPRLQPEPGSTAHLVARHPYQHLGERAIYEAAAPTANESDPNAPAPGTDPDRTPDGEAARPVPPVAARPARGSRIVFSVPAGTRIPFTVEGILAALRHLPMVVHPLATPRPGRLTLPLGPSIVLGDNLVATLGPDVVAVTAATRRTPIPDPTTTSGLSAIARGGRRLRSVLGTTAAVGLRVDDVLDAREPDRHIVIGDDRVTVPGLRAPGRIIRPDLPIRVRRRPRLSRPPEELETAIEAPYRLIVSPSARGGWTHADAPVGAEGASHRIELWHSRLGVRVESDDQVEVDEQASRQRIIRAVWARDREQFPDWETQERDTPAQLIPHDDIPFRSSLDRADRHMLVRQSAETWVDGQTRLEPDPVDARALWLSALGAWLDYHGQWDTVPYSNAALPSILSWDHVAPMGRDQFVRVVYPGFLYPFGHRAALIKLTERKMKDASPSIAGLYQRKFIVVGEPEKVYDQNDLPMTRVRVAPLVTPTIDDPGNTQNSFFFPRIDGDHFQWVLHCRDHEDRPVRLVAPLLWVAEHFSKNEGDRTTAELAYRNDPAEPGRVAADGQEVAFAAVAKGGDTLVPANLVAFDGEITGVGQTRPRMVEAKVTLPAVERLSPVGTVTIAYTKDFVAAGFGGGNVGEVWAEVTSPTPELSFGGSPSAGSDKAGGFLTPDLPIRGLSRIAGTVGDVASTAAGDFDPAAFLAGALPELFGLVPLVDLLEAVGLDLDDAPNVVSEALDRVEGFLADLERAKRTVEDAVKNAELLVDRYSPADKAAELKQQAQQALAAAQQLETTVTNAVDAIIAQFAAHQNATKEAIDAALANPLQALRDALDEMETVAPLLPPLVRQQLQTLATVLRTIVDAVDLIEDVFRFLNGLASGSLEVAFRFEWKPVLRSWPSPAAPFLGITDPIVEIVNPRNSLVLAVDGRAASNGEFGVEVLAELRDFILNLLPGETLVRFKFDHLSFKAGTNGKPDVDVVLQDIEFVGILGFIETLKDLIPFDGFSDPPFLDVDASGLKAGFTLALPNVAIGVFSLSNMSLGADVHVPFLGETVTVGFNFCTRERPFTLAVAFIGGGGWFLLRLSPDGLDVLELGLEAGAVLAVDFGVASGSISAMLGIYMRLEGDTGSLTGYFRLRGEVDVLGLISASIELYLEMRYEFDTGKMVGRAALTIKVEVLFFSASVTIEAERRFAGSNGDPTFADVMGLEADGTSPAWSEYCLAFAGA